MITHDSGEPEDLRPIPRWLRLLWAAAYVVVALWLWQGDSLQREEAFEAQQQREHQQRLDQEAPGWRARLDAIAAAVQGTTSDQ